MHRGAALARLHQDTFGLVVIGGGIIGAGVAREAALRGLPVALVEQGDFAAGTSSRSTKLVHGGLRYLKSLNFRLVRESVVERRRLLAMAPHLVRLQPFVFPIYRGDPDGRWRLRAGLTLYDWFAGRGWNSGHQAYAAGELLRREPCLAEQGLLGGAIYFDCLTDDARLTVETVLDASRRGAVAVNYATVTGFLFSPVGAITGVTVRDELTGTTFPVQARRVLNATGPWLDHVRRLADPAAPHRLRLTKGVHLTVGHRRLPLQNAVVLRGPEGRLMFAVPRDGCTYLGTTDTDYVGDPAAVTMDAPDLTYILAAANHCFPQAQLTLPDVVSSWAGVRALVDPGDGRSPGAVSRDFALFADHGGLVSVGGGKLTTFRAMAAAIVTRLFPTTSARLEESLAPLPGGAGASGGLIPAPSALATGLPAAELALLASRYGAQLPAVLAELAELAELPEFPSDAPQGSRTADGLARLTRVRAEARYAVRVEMAQRLLDVLGRRTGELLFTPDNGRAVAQAVAAEMAQSLAWSSQQTAAELATYATAVAAMFPGGRRGQANGMPRS